MDRKFIAVAPVMLLLLAGVAMAAMPNQVEAQRGKAAVTMPSTAAEVAPGVFYLGKAFHEGRIVQGYAFVKYKKAFGKPTGCKDDGVCQGWEAPTCADCLGGGSEDPDTSSCYVFLARGAKWKTVEPYIVDPSNTHGLDETFVRDNFANDIAKWESAAGRDILGNEISGIVDGADTVSPDGRNEVYFGSIDSPGAIAVTIVWGIFGGPPPFRELVEWDHIYDQEDFDWSAAGEAGKMDFESIVTHELGHSMGLGDLYMGECSEQTMYGYASNGETNKRTLESGDIAGISALY